MGHIGSKLLPHLLRFNAVGHIHQQHDRSENTAHLHPMDIGTDVLFLQFQQVAHRRILSGLGLAQRL